MKKLSFEKMENVKGGWPGPDANYIAQAICGTVSGGAVWHHSIGSYAMASQYYSLANDLGCYAIY